MSPNPLSLLLFAAAAAAAAPEAPPVPPPVHLDARALEDGVVEATRALLRGDAVAARAALDRAAEGCRKVPYDDAPPWPRAIVNDDIALHMALDKARELTSRGDIERAVETLVWVGRTCRECHARAANENAEVPGKPKSLLKPEAVPVR